MGLIGFLKGEVTWGKKIKKMNGFKVYEHYESYDFCFLEGKRNGHL